MHSSSHCGSQIMSSCIRSYLSRRCQARREPVYDRKGPMEGLKSRRGESRGLWEGNILKHAYMKIAWVTKYNEIQLINQKKPSYLSFLLFSVMFSVQLMFFPCCPTEYLPLSSLTKAKSGFYCSVLCSSSHPGRVFGLVMINLRPIHYLLRRPLRSEKDGLLSE